MNKILETAIQALDEKKAKDILVYDFHDVNPFIDYVVISSATNMRQVYALADNVVDRMQEAGLFVRHMEGNKDSRWILVDLDTVIVHVFYDEERHTYQLEKLYADLPQVDVSI